MAKITLWPSMESIEVKEGSTMLQSLKSNGKQIKSSCGGKACCGECTVKVKSSADGLSSPEYNEIKLLGNVFHITKERLSCQTKVLDNVTIDISSHPQSIKNEIPSFKANSDGKEINKSSVKVRKKKDFEEKKPLRDEKVQKEKRPGGGRRPRAFRYSEDD